jgi:hypothetical protein
MTRSRTDSSNRRSLLHFWPERFPGSRVIYLGRQLEHWPMSDISYRSLEHSCQRQASITSNPEARKALEEMAREYRDRADHEEHQQDSEEE